MAAFYPTLGDALKQRFAGWHAWLFTGDLRLAKLVRLTVSRRIPLFNGAIECRLFAIALHAGRMPGARAPAERASSCWGTAARWARARPHPRTRWPVALPTPIPTS